jgi:YtfJ family uncharacterized protein
MKKILLSVLVSTVSIMAIEVGKVPTSVSISGKDGGRTDGNTWNSASLKGKVQILFYVDPDEKDKNEALNQALKKETFDRSKFASVAIVNMAATWMPNIAIESKLKSKQKEFPQTTYVRDRNKVLVKKWGLEDDNSDVLVFDKNSVLIYKKFGKLSSAEIKEVILLIKKHL